MSALLQLGFLAPREWVEGVNKQVPKVTGNIPFDETGSPLPRSLPVPQPNNRAEGETLSLK